MAQGVVEGEQTPLSMESAVAVPPVICHDRVALLPATMVAGDTLTVRVKGTVTVVVWVEVVPSDEVAVRVKLVVEVMGTTSDPEVDKVVPSGIGTAGAMATDAAFVVAQVRVLVWPPLTSVGLALNVVICGTIGGGPEGVGLLEPMLQPGRVQTESSVVAKTILRRYA